MKFCSTCGQQLPDSARFCSKCGTKQNLGHGQRSSTVDERMSNQIGTSGIGYNKAKELHEASDYLKILLLIPIIISAVVGLIASIYGVPAGLITVLLGAVIFVWPYRAFSKKLYRRAFWGSLGMGLLYAFSTFALVAKEDIMDAVLQGIFAGCLLYVANVLRVFR